MTAAGTCCTASRIVAWKPGAHLTDLRHPWRRIPAHANLEDVKVHDLRHTCAVYPPNPLFLLSLFFFLKIRNHLVTGVDRIPDAACGACRATPTIFENRAIPAIAFFAPVSRLP